jgi:PAS domain S-box-containing protein
MKGPYKFSQEMKSANEEMETSREELQSLNEELAATNGQLQTTVQAQESLTNELSNFFSSINIPTLFLDHEFKVRRFTLAMTKLIKLIPSDIGRPLADMSLEYLGAGALDDARMALADLEVVKQEIPINDSFYERSTLPYRTADNRIEGVVMSFIDITERKRTEEALRESEERYRALVQFAPAGIYEVDFPSGRFTEVNDVMCRILGYTPEELLAMNAADVLEDDDKARFSARIRRALTGEKPEEAVEYRVRTKDGRVIWALLNTTFRRKEGKFIGATVVAHDITERKRAEEELKKAHDELEIRVQRRTVELREAMETVRKERHHLFDVLETLPVYVILLSKDYHVPFANRFFRERFGASGGRRCYEYLFNRTESCENCETFKVLETNAPHHWEWIGPDERNYDIYDFPFMDTNGSALILEMGIDVTATKKAQAALKQANDTLEVRVSERTTELAASNKELESFSYSVSHDLRAPLRAMKGFGSILLEEYANKLDGAGRDFLKRIVNGADKMSGIIDDMLSLAKISRQEMNRVEINLTSLAGSVVAELRHAEPERNVNVLLAEDLKAHGDAHLMKIALSNMLDNAWKYSRKTPDAKIEFAVTEKNGERVYYVRDNGAGFNMAQAHRLFSPFERLHSESQFPGTGIGLAIVNRVVERHGGRIWAESEVGKGAAFYFTIGKTGGGEGNKRPL